MSRRRKDRLGRYVASTKDGSQGCFTPELGNVTQGLDLGVQRDKGKSLGSLPGFLAGMPRGLP